MHTPWRQFAIISVLSAALACGDSTGSGGLEGVYQLFELNGQPMAYDPGTGCCLYSSGSLTLTGGNYTASLTVQDKTSSMISIITEQGTYTVNGDALAFQRTTGGTYNFYFFNGLLNGRVIRVQLGGSSAGAADQYPAGFRR